MSDELSNLVRHLQTSYLGGSELAVPQERSDDDLKKLQMEVRNVLRNRLSRVEMDVIESCETAYREGLRSARTQQMVSARQYFAEARVTCESRLLSEEGRAFCQSFLGAAEAYLGYCFNDLNRARQLLWEALATDEILETRYGYRLLHAHRIHLVRNLIRIETQSGNLEGALDMACRLLCYLEGKSNEAPAPGLWGESYRGALAPGAIARMFSEVIEEVCHVLAGRTAESSHGLFAVFDRSLPAPNPALWHPHAYDCFIIKRAFVKEDLTSFLTAAAHYLRKGPGPRPILWRYVVLDVAMVCDTLPIVEAKELQRDILKRAPKWSGMTAKTRLVVQDLASQFACRSMCIGSTRH